MSQTFYVTTPIYYVNDVPHLGHAYTTIAADVLARYNRSAGRPTHFLTGTDEHGQKIFKSARRQGVAPLELADRVVERFRSLWRKLHISYDDFIRTTEPRHQQVVQRLFERVRDQGDIYLGTYEGLYCTGCEEYYTEAQAEQGRCPIHKQPLERLREDSYFFRMSRYGEQLRRYIEQHPEFIQPEIRRNEILGFLREGLRDLSISRTSFDWGVAVPGDPRHVIYVWFDALSNYISALGWDGSPAGGELFARFWPALHLIGKDILRFHAVYWPTFLMSAGLPLPRTVYAHGWWTVEGEKMSKSLRNVVEPQALVEAYGVDAVRYFLLREVPFGLDGDFSHRALVGRFNAELANDLGNLLRRTVAMVGKYCEGRTPAAAGRGGREQNLVELAQRVVADSAAQLEKCQFHKALVAIWELVRASNRYLDEAAPWSLHKNGEQKRLHTVMAHAMEALRYIAVLVAPFLPTTAGNMLEQLGLEDNPDNLSRAGLQGWPGRASGRRVRPGAALFPRLEEERVAELRKKFQAGAGETATASGGDQAGEERMDTITIEQFQQVELRVGVVKQAERVPKSNKLIVMQVDLGESEPRQVVAGIGQAYTPEQLLGKRLAVVANLKPVKLMGVESRGMILAAGPGGTDVVVAEFTGEVQPGESIH